MLIVSPNQQCYNTEDGSVPDCMCHRAVMVTQEHCRE